VLYGVSDHGTRSARASTLLLAGAAELVVSTGALEEAAPLAEFVEEG